ncbi:MAG: hypothetical protein JKX85_16305, partial [Phycisphaeraceae bacterium]|nr:hypothetical protein [Phycisphaeraceae bacterium]
DEMLDETVIATPDSVDEALDNLDTFDAEESLQDEDLAIDDSVDSSDDVIAEADVYISYGLYQQAEELLKDGLAKDPANIKYQVKLAEIYHGDKKSDEFVQHVEAIEADMDKQSPEWSKIVSMGAALVPAHALFAGSEDQAVSNQPAEQIVEDDDVEDFSVASEDIEDFEGNDLDDNSLDFTFGDDGGVSDEVLAEDEDSLINETQAFVSDGDEVLEESSTAVLEAGLEFDEDDATQAFDMSGTNLTDAAQDNASEPSEADDSFLDFDGDQLEKELNSATHDSETEMLDQSLASSIDLEDAINLDDDIESADNNSGSGVNVDNDLDDILDGNDSETAMFDGSLFDVDSSEAQAFAEGGERVDEDTVSLEQVQENLTAELETLSFDADDIDLNSIEEDSLPTLQTSEIGKPDLDDLDENLAASETGTFERDMLADEVTEQFDVGNIDATMTDLGEFGDDYDLENPSVVEEIGTKLDLAKAFVDMGDEDAAKETLTEVIEQGDQTQIQQAKDLLDKLN